MVGCALFISFFLSIIVLSSGHTLNWLSGHDDLLNWGGDANNPAGRRNVGLWRDWKNDDPGFYIAGGRASPNDLWYFDGSGTWAIKLTNTGSEDVDIDFHPDNRIPSISHFAFVSTNSSGWLYGSYDVGNGGKLYELSFSLEQWRRARDDSLETQSIGSSPGEFGSDVFMAPHRINMAMYFREDKNTILMTCGGLLTASGDYSGTGGLDDLYEYSISLNQYRWINGTRYS